MKQLIFGLLLALCGVFWMNAAFAKESALADGKRNMLLRKHKAHGTSLTKKLKASHEAVKRAQSKVRELKAALAKAKRSLKSAQGAHRRNTTTYRMTVKECKKAMRATFTIGTSRATRRKWLGRCETTYAAAKSISR